MSAGGGSLGTAGGYRAGAASTTVGWLTGANYSSRVTAYELNEAPVVASGGSWFY
jgi:hypothetical protein